MEYQKFLGFRNEEEQEKRHVAEQLRIENEKRKQLYFEQAAANRILVRPWCNPLEYNEIIGADLGAGIIYLFKYHLRTPVEVRIEEFSEAAASLGEKTLLVMEKAHLGTPQTSKSLAQPFTPDELLEIYRGCEQAGVDVRLFPHAHTRKARDWVAVNFPGEVEFGKTTDENDAKGLAFYVANHNGISLAKPPKTFERSDASKYGDQVRFHANIVLNASRSERYEGRKFPYIAMMAGQLFEQVNQGEESFIDQKVAFSICALVATEIDGTPVKFTYKHRVPAYRFWIRHVAKFTPFHHRGGVSRSNMHWHRFRPFLAKFAARNGVTTKDGQKYVPFAMFDDVQEYTRRQAWKSVRSEMKSAYRIANELSKRFCDFEVLQKNVSFV